MQLDSDQPVTASFEAAIVERKTRKKDPWYNNHKEHWLNWLKEYDGPGYYGRQTWNVSAENVYNRVVNPSMVLWLGEAAGVPKKQVREACNAALTADATMAAQSAAIRKVISWSKIREQL